MDLDLALRIEQTTNLMDKSFTDGKRDSDKWDHSNRISLTIIKHGISITFGDIMFDR